MAKQDGAVGSFVGDNSNKGLGDFRVVFCLWKTAKEKLVIHKKATPLSQGDFYKLHNYVCYSFTIILR